MQVSVSKTIRIAFKLAILLMPGYKIIIILTIRECLIITAGGFGNGYFPYSF
jgi:hypothetical protein